MTPSAPTDTQHPSLPFGASAEHRVGFGLAWLLVARPGYGRKLNSWLAQPRGSTSKSYLVDVSDGSIRFGARDVVIVLERGKNRGTLHVPRCADLAEIEVARTSLECSALPSAIAGRGPKVVDAALIRFSGGARREKAATHVRSALELDLDRLCTRRFRENATTTRKVSERALAETALSLLLQGVFHRSRAEALRSLSDLSKAGVSEEDVIAAYTSASAAFLAAGYHRAAQESARAANRLSVMAALQGRLFDDAPAVPERPRHRLGIQSLPCAALPLAFGTPDEVFDRRLGETPVGCNLVEAGTVRLDPVELRKWLLETPSDTMVPNIRVARRANGDEPVSLTMALTSDMAALLGMMPDARQATTGTDGDWLVVPRISGRPFSPSSAPMAPNQAVVFTVPRDEHGRRGQLSMTLLTPSGGPANILLPHTL